MKPPLRSIVRNASLVLIGLGLITIYLMRVARVYLAEQSVKSTQIEGVERAIRLVPDNADYYHLLGVQLSASDQDYDRAAANLRQAVTLNPINGRYWLDLASVYQVTDNVAKLNEVVKSAVAAEPNNPDVGAEAALFFLVAGDTARAWPLFRRALVQNPDAATTILSVCWRKTHDARVIWSQVIPESPELQLEFLRILVQQKETVAARQVWQDLMTTGKPFQPHLSFFYFDYLLRERDGAGFNLAWHDLAALIPSLRSYLPNDNRIVNAGFEQPLLNAGFDWRHEPVEHIAAGLDDTVAHSGARSLSLTYDGNPVSEAGWKQFVPVQPQTDYEFSAWIRSDQVTSSSGPRFALVDAFSDANLLLTDDVLDTHPWEQMKGTLHVPAGTELIAVKIVRTPAATRIDGRVWVDDLRLEKK